MSHLSPRKASLPRTVPGGAFGPRKFEEGLLLQNARPKWGLDGLLNWNQRIVKEECVVTNSQINSMAARGLGTVQLKEPVSTEYLGGQTAEFATRKWHLMQDLMEREMSKRKVHHLYTHTHTHVHTRTHTYTHTHSLSLSSLSHLSLSLSQAPVPRMDMHHTAANANSLMMTARGSPHLRKLRARRDEEGMVTHRGRLERSGGTEPKMIMSFICSCRNKK